MSQYIYEITSKGQVQRGKIYADSISEAALQIKKPGWVITELKEQSFDTTKFIFFKSKLKFPLYEKINFTDHLASAISSGTPVQEALEAYIESGDKKSEIIDTINKDIQRGKKLSEAMSKHPAIFSPLYIALVQAGEISGSLDETLEYLANELRRQHKFISGIKSALFYPTIVLAVSIIVVILVIGVIVPKIIEITRNFGGELPLLTKMVVVFAEFLNKYAIVISAVTIAGIVALVYMLRNLKIRNQIKSMMIRIPLVGLIVRQYILARFLRVVGGCIKYGVQLPKALDLSASVVDNIIYKRSCENINKKIIHGQSLSVALSDEEKLLFPPIISRTIRGGEKSGKVETGLLRLSSYYEAEVDRNLKRLTEMIEPIMIIGLGFLVALIAISVIAPIYQMTSKIR